MYSHWVGHIKEDSTLSAHILLVAAHSSDTCRSVQRGRIDAALGLRLPLQPDVAGLAPGGAPAVPDQPVVAIGSVSSISGELDHVVEANVLVEGAAGEYATPV